MNRDAPDRANIQANILRGTKRWGCACYVFLRIEDRQGAAELVKELLSSQLVGTAASVYPNVPDTNINVAFSHAGLTQIDMQISDALRYQRKFLMRALQHDSVVAAQDHGDPGSAFEGGMFSADLGDTWPIRSGDTYQWPDNSDANAWWTDDTDPKPWRDADEWPHLLVWISAASKEARGGALDTIRAWIDANGGVTEIGCQLAKAHDGPAKAHDGPREHFGFVDGVSQPAVEGFRPGNPGDGKLSARGWQGLPVGEFILGYPDEGYGPSNRLDVDPLARDGTFLVYRKLRQDVAAFRKASSDMAGGSALTDAEIEAKMMGRRHDGGPLVVPSGAPDPPAAPWLRNDFTYSKDPDGSSCPLGSHVRRANPRDDLHFEGRRVNRHRIIRRGMPYGDPYDPDNEDDDGNRGLIFIAFNARIEDQFEFIQKQWLNGGRAFRLGDDADPIAGNGEDIRIVINGDKPVLHCQPEPFTRFLGGDYFFVPSISTLEQIASGT
ncbi:MAG: Dyp-type peroxidase [Actinomycetota bacterium]